MTDPAHTSPPPSDAVALASEWGVSPSDIDFLVDFFLKEKEAQEKAIEWLHGWGCPKPVAKILVKFVAAKLLDAATAQVSSGLAAVASWGLKGLRSSLRGVEDKLPTYLGDLFKQILDKGRAIKGKADWFKQNLSCPAGLDPKAWDHLDEDARWRIHLVASLNKTQAAVDRLAESFRIRPRLTTFEEIRALDPASPAHRLNAAFRYIALIGREEEVASLQEWLGGEKRVSFRVLTGPAGCGKTRLALELCLEAEGVGWHAGFIRDAELEVFVDGLSASWEPDSPALIVVDYAASRTDKVSELLGLLVSRTGEEELPIRVLLLERHGEKDRGWWLQLMGRGVETEKLSLRAAFDPPEPTPLPPLGRREDQGKVMKSVFLAQQKAIDPPSVEDGHFYEGLNRLTNGGEPLLLQMAAEVAAEKGIPWLLTLRREGLVEFAVERERSRWEKIAKARRVPFDLLDRMFVLATLCEDLSREQARRAVTPEAAEIGFGNPPRETVLQALLECSGLPGATVPRLSPDLLGEWLIWSHLKRFEEAGALALLRRASSQNREAVIRTLIRLAQDFHDEESRPEPLLWLSHLVDPESAPTELLLEVERLLPEHTLVLREYAVPVTEKLLSLLRTEAADEEGMMGLRAERGRLLNNLSVRLSELGRREEAHEACREAVELYRALAAQRPDAFRPALASSLNNLSGCLSELGRREEGLKAIGEAVELYRGLAAQRPDAFRPDLASSLNNLSNRLSELGRREEALGAIEEAVAIRRALAAQRPDAFRPDLATSLNNLSNRLSGLGRREEALGAIEEAVELYRGLAAQRPDAFRPDLAMSLGAMHQVLAGLGREAEALERVREGVEVLRPLFLALPPAHARLMANLAGAYLKLCESPSRTPDAALLGPIAEAFERLRKEAGEENTPS